MEIRDKRVTVVGLGRSGVGAANLLSELGADVTVTDRKTQGELKNFIGRLKAPVTLALGSHPEDIFISADMVIISPGVSLDILPLLKAKEKGIPVIGELELAYQIVGNQKSDVSSNPPFPFLIKGGERGFLAVTGTNGKSTTTSLLDFMLRKSGFKTILGGNIGVALTEEIRKVLGVRGKDKKDGSLHASRFTPNAIDFIVTEVSSFQLESIMNFRPGGAVILNITPDHLDRYHSIKEYQDAKAKVFKNQKDEDFLLLNADDPGLVNVMSEKLKVKSERPNILYFSRKKEVEGVYFKDGKIYCNFPDSLLSSRRMNLSIHPTGQARHSLLLNVEEIKIRGVHNLENAMAASAMALLAGSSLEEVRESLREFPGLEHRLEFVREIDGVRYFNDSKGTNVGAVIKSLGSFQDSIILIAGGRDKAGDFSTLRDLVKERVKALVLIGEASDKIKRSLGNLTETVMAKNLKDAVTISRDIASRGDVVLLSPACASFDMFVNFEDRGRQFKKIVMGLK
jgi:UDP-N-acetylmuramoylalanine--D-glutamate ligase